jgi:NAD(P)H-nitrite reductase large subunit
MQNAHYIILGNGVAGNTAANVIRETDKNAIITMISKEPFPEYSACVLSKKYISKEMNRKEIFLRTFDNYFKKGIKTVFGKYVFEINAEDKKVFLEDGDIRYDKLIIATGSSPMILPIEGIDKKGIFNLKSLDDAKRISNWKGERVVVIGAGPIGLEASLALRKIGWKVSVVELLGWVLPKAFDEKPSTILRELIETYGIEVLTNEKVIKMEGDSHVNKVITDKREIECDMVILALGMKPEVELARKAGIEIASLGGIRVNEQMMTSIKDIYACGDCIEAKDIITGKSILSPLWHNAKQQGEVAGYNSTGIRTGYPGALNISSIDILGVNAVSIGHIMDRFRDSNLEIIESGEEKYYYRLLTADGVFVGAQFIGKIKEAGLILSAILRGDSLEKLRTFIDDENLLHKRLWFYRAYPYIRSMS